MQMRIIGCAFLLGVAVPTAVRSQATSQNGPPQEAGSIVGTVVSVDTKQPIARVTVSVVGTSVRASADNGRFILRNVPVGTHRVRAQLIGYAERIVDSVVVRAGQPTPMEIGLTPVAVNLAEVVSTGYVSQTRATIAGSVASVSGAQLAEAPTSNLVMSMAGRLPGVIINNRSGVPGSESTSLLVRGAGAFSNNGPLVVVDGVVGRDFARINPNEIESMTVLKDASAAIYGAQAGNGVILVTTKQGGGPPRITFSSSYGYSQPTALTRLVDSWDYAVYINELNQSLGSPALYTKEQIDLFRSGSDPLRYPNTNWIKAVTRPRAPQAENQLDVSGGSGAVQYFVSGRYLNQEGIFRDPSPLDFKQYGIRSNVTAQIRDNLSVQFRASGQYEDRMNSNFSANDIFQTAASNYPVQNAVYPNGLPSTGIEFNNPLVRATGLTGYAEDKDFDLNSTLNFRLDLPAITEGLYVSGLGAFDLGFSDSKTFNNKWDWVEYDPTTGKYIDYQDRTGNRSLSRALGNSDRRTLNFRVGLDRSFGKHGIQSFVAHERSQLGTQSLSAARTGFVSDQLQELGAGPTDGWSNGGGSSHTARMHYFGRLAYDFDKKYIVDFTLRRDGSDRFPPEGRWGNFPGVSTAWRISSEPFFKLHGINDMKLKASWGRLGSDGAGNYQFLARYAVNQTAYVFGSTPLRVPGLNPQAEPNPSITWETVDKWNTGVEATMAKGKLTVDLNTFWDDRKGLLIQRSASVPLYTGLSLPNQNLGRVKKNGFDGSVMFASSYRGVQYSVAPNLVYAKTKIVFMDEAVNTLDYQRRTGDQIDSYLIYQDCGLFRSAAEVAARPVLAGTAPGDICFVDTNKDGAITPADRIRVYDSATPRLQGGVNTSTGYKGVNLELTWQFQDGSKVFVMPQAINAPVTPPKWLFDDRWTPDNPDAKWPRSFDRRNTRNAEQSTFWLRNASYVRLKNVQLSYEIPPGVSARMSMQNMRVYFQGFNFFTATGIEGYDPELNVVNTYNYPQQKIINIGVSGTFGGTSR